MRLVLAALATAAALTAAPAAQGAQRYAAPGGSGNACSQAAPCSLPEAITKAASNDEVIVGPGTYSVSAPLFPPAEAANVYIHGDLSAPMPRIAGMTGGVPIGMTAGSHVSYLEISNSGSFAAAAICNPGGLIDRVRLLASGEGATGLVINGNCRARDSLVLADGRASIAVFAYGYSPATTLGIARNLTALASGPQSSGIVARYTEELKSGSYTLNLRNSIASGEEADLATRPNPWGPASIAVSNSNFDLANAESGTISGEANQSTPPLFADAAAGDYREAPGSPTIDAGVADQLGATDLEGNPRTLGAAPDIGAFEYVPPPPQVARIESLSLKPAEFRAAKVGAALVSGAKRKVAVGTTVRYTLSAAGSVSFTVERRMQGRRVGKRCVRPTGSNRDHRKCARFRRRKGGFTLGGVAGGNSFRLSGRLNGRTLRPGPYRLVGQAGDSVKRAAFRIAP